ncbi:MAG: hypothetical protein PVJ43_14350, partial [Gemmatimonadales bacterium]
RTGPVDPPTDGLQFELMASYTGPPLSGAIFTTTEDGSIVNENVRYQYKEDVYLDGGPGPNAPVSAAALPQGDYFFQVTDPSGKDLLSTDHISCRMIHINEYGVIDHAYAGTNYVKDKGSYVEVPCQHKTGIDVDYGSLGAITVQLFPYDDTPNRGGVYKAWVTPVDAYAGPDIDCLVAKGGCNVNGEDYAPGNFHGFIPAFSKTDNYKVKGKFEPPEITVRKFYDGNVNGVQDIDEPDITGWLVMVTDPSGVMNTIYTPMTIVAADAGAYTFVEGMAKGFIQTVSILDGVTVSLFPYADPTVIVNVEAKHSGETHEVVYGNVCTGTADFDTKGYWHNKNGLGELTQADIDYVNGLAPYSSPSTYFDRGDEPFDGFFGDGTPVEAAYNNDKITDGISAGEGTAKAEVSLFLTDSNAGGDAREQLAQQLLAFIFNTIHRLDGADVAIQKMDGTFVSAQSLIDAAIAAWTSGTAAEQTAIKDLLDWFNNNDSVTFISPTVDACLPLVFSSY